MGLNLLRHLLNEHVAVLTTSKTLLATESGEYVEAPYTVEGLLIDYDEDYLLIGEPPEIVNREQIVSIKLIDPIASAMDDGDRPKPSEMN